MARLIQLRNLSNGLRYVWHGLRKFFYWCKKRCPAIKPRNRSNANESYLPLNVFKKQQDWPKTKYYLHMTPIPGLKSKYHCSELANLEHDIFELWLSQNYERKYYRKHARKLLQLFKLVEELKRTPLQSLYLTHTLDTLVQEKQNARRNKIKQLAIFSTIALFVSFTLAFMFISTSDILQRFAHGNAALRHQNPNQCLAAYRSLSQKKSVAKELLLHRYDMYLDKLMYCHVKYDIDRLARQWSESLNMSHSSDLGKWQTLLTWQAVCDSNKKTHMNSTSFVQFNQNETQSFINQIRQFKTQICSDPIQIKHALNLLDDTSLAYTAILNLLAPLKNQMYSIANKNKLENDFTILLSQAQQQTMLLSRKLNHVKKNKLINRYQKEAILNLLSTSRVDWQVSTDKQKKRIKKQYYTLIRTAFEMSDMPFSMSKRRFAAFFDDYVAILAPFISAPTNKGLSVTDIRATLLEPERFEQGLQSINDLFNKNDFTQNEDWLLELFTKPIQLQWRQLQETYWQEIAREWSEEIIDWANLEIYPYYPFNRHGKDLSLNRFKQFMHPKSGKLAEFMQSYITPFQQQTNRALAIKSPLMKDELAKLNHLIKIGQLFWSTESDLTLGFSLYPEPHSKINHFVIQYANQHLDYRNGLQEWNEWQWPQKAGHTIDASLEARSEAKNLLYMREIGEWSLFRLLGRASRVVSINSHVCRITWPLSRHPTMQSLHILIDTPACKSILDLTNTLKIHQVSKKLLTTPVNK